MRSHNNPTPDRGADDLLLVVNSVTRQKMPRIENDVKLDFKDVLIRPKR
jgi:hypothetical protein